MARLRGFTPINTAAGQRAAWEAGEPIVLKVHGQRAVIANIYRTYDDIVQEMRDATERTARRTHKLAYQLSPVDTGRMRESLRYDLSPDKLAFDVYFDPLPFLVDGVPYYPPFQEFGTKFHDAQPSLIPAFRAYDSVYKTDIRKSVRKGIARNRLAA